MKTVTATRARQDFFRLLDRAVKGESVVIDRNGVPLRLARMPRKGRPLQDSSGTSNYRRYLHGPVDDADRWHWSWDAEQGLRPDSKDR